MEPWELEVYFSTRTNEFEAISCNFREGFTSTVERQPTSGSTRIRLLLKESDRDGQNRFYGISATTWFDHMLSTLSVPNAVTT